MNRKILFSILAIGMFAIVASASTWAYYQDTLASTGNLIKTGYIDLVVNYVESDPNNVVTIPGYVKDNVMADKPIIIGGVAYIPERQVGTEPFVIQNMGTVPGKLYVQFQSTDESLGLGSGIQVNLHDNGITIPLYNNGKNLAPVTSDPVFICDVPQGGAPTTLTLMYRLADTGENQKIGRASCRERV